MIALLWVATHLVAAAVGYGVCVAIQRYRTRERERVLRALGGQLPDWELSARKIEAEAHEHAIKARPATARELWGHADTVRVRGRRRDKEWR